MGAEALDNVIIKNETTGEEETVNREQIIDPNEIGDAIDLRDALCSQNSKKSEELIDNFFSGKASMEDMKLMMRLVERDIDFIEQNPVNENTDAKQKKELICIFDMLDNATKMMQIGIIEYARGLSRDMAAPKESDEKVGQIKEKMVLTIENLNKIIEIANKKREESPDYKLEDEDNIRRSIARLESEIKQQ